MSSKNFNAWLYNYFLDQVYDGMDDVEISFERWVEDDLGVWEVVRMADKWVGVDSGKE